jgi:hypothetical protein
MSSRLDGGAPDNTCIVAPLLPLHARHLFTHLVTRFSAAGGVQYIGDLSYTPLSYRCSVRLKKPSGPKG